MATRTSCFLVLMWGQRFIIPPNHLFTCLHEKSWRSLDRGNQRVYFWVVSGYGEGRGRYEEGSLFVGLSF